MPQAKQNEPGLVIARLLLGLMGTASSVFLHEDLGASRCDEVLLCAAVYIGQVEGRTMSAAKLAEYIGMPRPTVVRKLRDLRERGLVDMDATRHWFIATSSPEISARMFGVIGALLPLIHKASAELTKMDSGRIAANDSAGLQATEDEQGRRGKKEGHHGK